MKRTRGTWMIENLPPSLMHRGLARQRGRFDAVLGVNKGFKSMAACVDSYFEDLKASTDLSRLARRGGVAMVVSVYGNGVLQIVGAIVLARLLTPEDFGLVAIVMVLTRFAPLLIDFGLADATTQRSHITQNQVSALFWLSSGIGIAMAIGLALCSPLIAWLYQEQRLQSLALCFAITFVFTGMSGQHLALLRRTMQFVTIAKIQFVSALVGFAVAVLIAVFGYGYWALVLRPVISAFCVAAGSWLACKWRPGSSAFDAEVKSMIRFGMHVLGFSIVYSISRVVDRIALSLFHPPSQVGIYQNALNMYENAILSPFDQLYGVGSAGLSKLRSNAAAVQQKYEATLAALAFFVMPTAAIMSVTGQDVTVILLGANWRESGLLLSIISLGGIMAPIEMSQGWLHVSSGKPERWKNWGIITLIVRLVAILGGLPFGAEGLAVAVVVASWLMAVPSVSYAGRPFGIGAALAVRAAARPLFGAMIAIAAGWWLQTAFLVNFSSLVRVFLSAFFCISIYLLIVAGLLRVTEPIRVAGRIVRDFRTRAAQH